MKLFITLLFVVSTMLIIAGCSSPIELETGGYCHFNDVKEIAKIINIKNNKVTLVTEQGQGVVIDKSLFTADDNLVFGSIYQLNIRRHISGGCSPYTIMSTEKLTIKGIKLSPSYVDLVVSEIILAEQQSLTKFKTTLYDIDATSRHACSPAKIKEILPQLKTKPYTDEVLQLVCFNSESSNKGITAILFNKFSSTAVINVGTQWSE